jgi:hypothetical protein
MNDEACTFAVWSGRHGLGRAWSMHDASTAVRFSNLGLLVAQPLQHPQC